jgi:hypothetical protein
MNLAAFIGMGFANTASLIGGVLLGRSAFWRWFREAVVSHMPVTLQHRLTPIH